MNIAVFGAGYVGLVTAACLAELGHKVTCFDSNKSKIDSLKAGYVPIHEPGLAELIAKGQARTYLRFTSSGLEAVESAETVFIAVGTPPLSDGSTDLNQVFGAVDIIRAYRTSDITLVIKSTVPVGTNAAIKTYLGNEMRISIISNPEFLKEGSAVQDSLKPDRIIIGVRTDSDTLLMRELYESFSRNRDKMVIMTPESAELVKYASNAMLATRISFMNEIAELSGHVGADIEQVRLGIGSDSRIGPHFLYSGIGFGGSCFPKDLLSLKAQMSSVGAPTGLIEAVLSRNSRQLDLVITEIQNAVAGDGYGIIAIWGISFKPDTDDTREAPSLKLARRLIQLGYRVNLTDPNVNSDLLRESLPANSSQVFPSELDAARGADVLVLATEWRQFRNPDFRHLRTIMRGDVLIDGRNQWNPIQAKTAGFRYVGVGRR